MEDKKKPYKCITCNGLGEVGVISTSKEPMLMVGCFDCDYDGLATKELHEWQLIHRVKQ